MNAVEAGHQQRREGEIRVGCRIREPNLDALGLRASSSTEYGTRPSGCAPNRRAAPGFIAGDEALVGVGRGVGEGVERLRVLDDAADIPQAQLREAGIFVACHHWLAALPDGLVDVHARTVIAENGLGHEGRGLAIGLRDVVDGIFVDLHMVGHRHERAELHAELVLRRSDFVVMLLDDDAHLGHRRQHFAAHILRLILLFLSRLVVSWQKAFIAINYLRLKYLFGTFEGK